MVRCTSWLAIGVALALGPGVRAGETAPDLLNLSAGVLPIAVVTAPADLRVGNTQAISLIDGSPTGFVLTPKPASAGDAVEIIYSLPAPTRFDRLAVPSIKETPSPSQTFVRKVDVYGSVDAPEGPWIALARAELATHDAAGLATELLMEPVQPMVRFVKVRLSGGIDEQRDKSFLEFSELIGSGLQQPQAQGEGFSGVWRGRGVKLELAQDGPTVVGCYDGLSRLQGTVDGQVLKALGEDAAGVPSQFILIVGEDGALAGLRSTNGAPFKPYAGTPAETSPACLAPEPPRLGCGSTVHGIRFGYDSAEILPQSSAVLDAVFAGLGEDGAGAVEIVGHSSSEGPDDYNLELSRRRAASVVAALVERGFTAAGLRASGRGESEPIASNADEAGRSLNRRVEIRCGA